MIPKVQRKILRRYTTDPILFGTRHSEMCLEGRMADVSRRGMQFCSPVAIDPGNQIWIRKTLTAGLAMNTGSSQAGIEATVCWCRKHLDNDDQPFSVGVTFCSNGI